MSQLNDKVSKLRIIPKTETLKEELKETLKKEFMFRSVSSSLLQNIVNAMFRVEVKEGDAIIKQGDAGDNFYVTFAGTFDCFIDKDGQREKVMEYSKGQSFGELALLYNSPRAASVIATSDAILWALDREAFNITLVSNSVEHHEATRLRGVPFLSPLSEKMLHDLHEHVRKKIFSGPSPNTRQGQLVLRCGQSCDALFIVLEGEVSIHSSLMWVGSTAQRSQDKEKSEKDDKVVRKCLPGGSFGGIEALTGRPASFDYYASKATTIQMIPKNHLDYDMLKDAIVPAEKLNLLMKAPAFRNFNLKQVEEVASCSTWEERTKGDVVCQEGQVAENFAILAEGELTMGTEKLAELGTSAGESVFTMRPEERLVKVSSPTARLVMLPAKESTKFMGIIEKAQMVHTLKDVSILQGLTLSEREALADAMEIYEFQPGETLIKQGDRGDTFFVLCQGEVAIYKRASSAAPEIELMRMTEGCFGERALLNDQPRAASVKSVTKGRVFTIGRASFEKHLGSLKELMQLHTQEMERQQMHGLIQYDELVPVRTIGVGSFGRVRLVQHKPTGNVFALKSLSKKLIIQYRQQQHLRNERLLMEKVTHPLCARLVKSFKDRAYVHILLEFCHGGELFHLMDEQPSGCFNEYATKFYAACVVLVLEHLHERGIVYRDLKPENLLLDSDGYIKVVDFGFAKQISGPTYTICGTPDYIAPEIIGRKGHYFPADYWALGVLVYEMLTGGPPFSNPDTPEKMIYSNILEGRYTMHSWMSPGVKDFISNLLVLDPAQRLGAGPSGVRALRNHPWFAEIDWLKLERKKLPPPIPIKVANILDLSNFDIYSEEQENAAPVNDTSGWDSCF